MNNLLTANLLTTAFIFGAASFAFSFLPFLFVVINGIVKSSSNQHHSSGIINTFILSFMAHFLSCMGFVVLIKALDVFTRISNGADYIQTKIFPIFWARGKTNILSLANGTSSGSITEIESAYMVLNIIQTIVDFVILIVPFVVFGCAISYGLVQSRKDMYNSNAVTSLVWVMISCIVSSFLFMLWIKITSIAMFIPNGNTLLDIFQASFRNILGI